MCQTLLLLSRCIGNGKNVALLGKELIEKNDTMLVKQRIEVTETVGACTEFFHLTFFVDTDRCRDFLLAVQQANAEYMRGKIKKGSAHKLVFNWLAFWDNVPNEICWKYGFQKEMEELPKLHVSNNDVSLFCTYDRQMAKTSTRMAVAS